MLSTFSLFLLLPSSLAFVGPKAIVNRRSKVILQSDFALNKEGFQSVDIDRAKHCAENFGSCSTQEIEELRDTISLFRLVWTNLHQERVQSFVYGGGHGLVSMSPDAIEHLLLEEELDLQLNLMSDIVPKPTLFPEVGDEMIELPHLKDDTISHQMEDAVHRLENTVAVQETILEESTLETLAMCTVVLALALAPQFFQF